jgi:hypothetical protein
MGNTVIRINYGGSFAQDNSTLNYVGGKIHEIGDEIECNTKYSDLVVLLEKTLGFNGVSKLFYKVPDMDLRIGLVR